MKRLIKVYSSAGGGKTTRIANRYIELLKNNIRFERILAITFTNLAALEMRERIIRILKELSIKGKSERTTITMNRKLAEKIVDNIIDNYSDFSVKTIDSFLYSLLKSCALDLSLPPEPEIVEDYDDIVRETLEILVVKGKEEKEIRDKIREILREEIKERRKTMDILKFIEKYIRILIDKESYVPYGFKVHKNSEVILDFYVRYFLKELKALKDAKDVIFISDIPKMVVEYIKREPVPYLFYKLGERFYHYLIDEFQDTSLIQWESIKVLIENALSSTDPERNPGTFFYVGDPKQSIYRWRGGRVELFDKVFNEFNQLDKSDKKEENIKKNYRSAFYIIEFLNRIFVPDSLVKGIKKIILSGSKNSGLYYKIRKYIFLNNLESKIYEMYSNSSQRALSEELSNKRGYVKIKILKDKLNKEDFIGKAFEFIENALEEIKNIGKEKRIGILVRKNEEAKLITKFLLEKGKSVVTSQEVNLVEIPFIKTIFYLLKFIENDRDSASLLNLVQTDYFPIIFEVDSKEIEKFLLSDENKVEILGKFFPQVSKIIEELRDYSKVLSPFYLLLEMDRVLKLRERFKKESLFVIELMEKTLTLRESISLYEFILKLERGDFKFSSHMYGNISVMTVHSAKGLEFDFVIFPFTKNNFFSGSETFIYDENKNTVFKKPGVKSDKKEKIILRCNHEFNDMLQEINLLYVALTRAKLGLYILLNPSEKGNTFSWSDVLYNILKQENMITEEKDLFEFGRKESEDRNIVFFDFEKSKNYNFPIYSPRISFKELYKLMFTQHEDIVEIGEETERGIWVHFVLSEIDFLNDQCFEDKIKRAISKAKVKFQRYFSVNKDFIEGSFIYFLDVLKDESIKPFFFINSDTEVKTEMEVFDGENLYRIDRVIKKGNMINICEFKTGSYILEEHVRQVKKYVEVLRKIEKDKDIKGFLLYLDIKKKVEVS